MTGNCFGENSASHSARNGCAASELDTPPRAAFDGEDGEGQRGRNGGVDDEDDDGYFQDHSDEYCTMREATRCLNDVMLVASSSAAADSGCPSSFTNGGHYDDPKDL